MDSNKPQGHGMTGWTEIYPSKVSKVAVQTITFISKLKRMDF